MLKTDISKYSHNGDPLLMNFPAKNKISNKILHIIKVTFTLLMRILVSLAIICAVTGTLILVSLNFYRISLLEDGTGMNINASKLALTSFVYVNDENGVPQEYQRIYNSENRIWVDFQDIPIHMKNAIISIEDKRFYDHSGVDWIRTSGAVFNLMKGTPNYGGSTLTQQLIKNITEDNQVSLTRKLREIFRAMQLEEQYSKDEILESYLNVVNFGGGSRGVQAAANIYFDKNIQDCSLVQCAAIAAITQNPTAYNPYFYPENNKSRRKLVLDEMLDQEKITQQEYNEAIEESETLSFSEINDKSSDKINPTEVRNWYVEAMLKDVVNDLSVKYSIGKSAAEDILYTQGIKIYAAMDTKAQNIAEQALKEPSIMPKDQNIELGYMMMDYNGRVLATIGSRNEKKGNLLYDRANFAKRQPGSTIKPLAAYVPTIDLGIYNYSSLLPDEPLHIDSRGDGVTRDWPVNWYGGYRGKVTLQWTIEKSANAPVAQVIKLLTPMKSYEFLTKKLEINSLDSSDAVSLSALATGGTHYGVTVREMTAAYQILGNGGKFNKPYTYFYVTDRDDKIILDNRDKAPTQAISSASASILNKLLRNVIIGPEGTGKSANIGNWNIIGKTGTTTDDFDSWFVGMSPYAVSGIWTGYDNPKRIQETGAAIRIWRHIMTKYLESKKHIDYNYDKDVFEAKYCKATGELATTNCPVTATGYYSNANVPKHCATHGGFPEITGGAIQEENSEESETPEERSNGEETMETNPERIESLTASIPGISPPAVTSPTISTPRISR